MWKQLINHRYLTVHLLISVLLYILFASLDAGFTLKGISGDLSLEGNPVMRWMMVHFGETGGLILGKCLVFLMALGIAIVAFFGIDKRAEWVYYLAFTAATRNWMKRKRRYWVAFIPLYFVALSQGMAAASWVFLTGD
jgi:hypothetical protein